MVFYVVISRTWATDQQFLLLPIMASLKGSTRLFRNFLGKIHRIQPLSVDKRLYGVTGNTKVDQVLTTVTGNRIDGWLQTYEDAVGLTEIKEAQDKVIQVGPFTFDGHNCLHETTCQ